MHAGNRVAIRVIEMASKAEVGVGQVVRVDARAHVEQLAVIGFAQVTELPDHAQHLPFLAGYRVDDDETVIAHRLQGGPFTCRAALEVGPRNPRNLLRERVTGPEYLAGRAAIVRRPVEAVAIRVKPVEVEFGAMPIGREIDHQTRGFELDAIDSDLLWQIGETDQALAIVRVAAGRHLAVVAQPGSLQDAFARIFPGNRQFVPIEGECPDTRHVRFRATPRVFCDRP